MVIEIVDFPIDSMVIFQFATLNYQRVVPFVDLFVIAELNILTCYFHVGLSENVGYIPNYSHLIGIMIMKTIGFRGTQHFQTHPCASTYPGVPVLAINRHCFLMILKGVQQSCLKQRLRHDLKQPTSRSSRAGPYKVVPPQLCITMVKMAIYSGFSH